MSSENKHNESGYNAWSEFYDSYPNPTVALDDQIFPQIYAEVRRQNVLEVGCGTGRHTLRLLAAENKVTGIDISEGMLAKLRRKTLSPALHLVQGDFLADSVPNGPFDSLLTSLVLEHVPDLGKFFKSSRKALKELGHMYVSEIHPDRTSSGVFAHFKNTDGSEIHLKSWPHTTDEISEAAIQNGFLVKNTLTVKGTQELAKVNAKWQKHFDKPMIQIWVFQAVG